MNETETCQSSPQCRKLCSCRSSICMFALLTKKLPRGINAGVNPIQCAPCRFTVRQSQGFSWPWTKWMDGASLMHRCTFIQEKLQSFNRTSAIHRLVGRLGPMWVRLGCPLGEQGQNITLCCLFHCQAFQWATLFPHAGSFQPQHHSAASVAGCKRGERWFHPPMSAHCALQDEIPTCRVKAMANFSTACVANPGDSELTWFNNWLKKAEDKNVSYTFEGKQVEV